MSEWFGIGGGKSQPTGLNASTHVEGSNIKLDGFSKANFHYGPNFHVNQQAEQHVLDVRVRNMPRSHNAEYNVIEDATRGPCTPGTRSDVLRKLTKWCKSAAVRLYWMNGIAGTGKTTISYTVCEMMKERERLGASFFCSRSLPDCRDINLIIPTIAYQLAQRYPQFEKALVEVLGKDEDIWRKSLDAQLQELIIEPWKKKRWRLPRNAVVVLDALDECDAGHSKFLEVLFAHVTKLPLKFLITSRPDFAIRDAMKAKDPKILSTFVLHEVENDMVQADIAKYLEHKLANRAPPDVILSLIELSGCLFIVAATLARMFPPGSINARARLELFKTSLPIQRQAMSSLDELYKGVISVSFTPQVEESTTAEMQEIKDAEVRGIKDVLFTVIYARTPLTRRAIAGLWNISEVEVDHRLDSLYSVLSVPQDHSQPIVVFHASLPDFVQDPSRSKELYCQPHGFNLKIMKRCLRLMRRELHQNLCHLIGRPLNDSVHPNTIQKHISPGLQYASVYWSEHWILSDYSKPQKVVNSIHDFMTTRALYWLECMSLTRRLSITVKNLEILQHTLYKGTSLTNLVHELLQFIRYFYHHINDSALQIYYHALTWTPLHSPLRLHYAHLYEQSPKVLCGLKTTWERFGPGQIITARPLNGESMVFSQNGRRVLLLPSLRILDTVTLQQKASLGTSDTSCTSGAFSISGTRIAAVCSQNGIRMWKLTSDGDVENHSDFSVPFSPSLTISFSHNERQFITTPSQGLGMLVWDIMTGAQTCHLSHLGSRWENVSSAVFSHDDTLIASSAPQIVCIWDAQSGQELHHFPVDIDTYSQAIMFSPDSRKILLSHRNTITIYSAKTGRLQHTYEGYSHWTALKDSSSYAFSDAGDVCYFSYFGSQPHKVTKIPHEYRPVSRDLYRRDTRGQASRIPSFSHSIWARLSRVKYLSWLAPSNSRIAPFRLPMFDASLHFSSGPLFTPIPGGVQVCLPGENGLATLMIPYDK